MIIKALASYGISVLLTAATAVAFVLFFNRTGIRRRTLHILLGAIVFIAIIICMFFVLMFAFSENSTVYMTSMMDEGTYKISVAIIFFYLIGLIRYFVINAAYFNKGKNDSGMSFMAGYGLTASMIYGLYCLFMFIYISVTACMHKFMGISDGQALMFDDGTGISVFTPFLSHIFIAIVFALYAVLIMIIAYFMDQHSKLPYKKHSTVLMYIITNACEILMISVILFAVSKISPIVISVICVFTTALAAVALRMLYKYKEELPYNRQFD